MGEQQELVRLDLGCGISLGDGWWGIDKVAWREDIDSQTSAHVVCDLDKGLPVRSGAADEVRMAHVLEHLVAFDTIFAEVSRVLRVGGKWGLIIPYLHHSSAFYPGHTAFIGTHGWLLGSGFVPIQPLNEFFRCERLLYVLDTEQFERLRQLMPSIEPADAKDFFWSVCREIALELRKRPERVTREDLEAESLTGKHLYPKADFGWFDRETGKRDVPWWP